MGRAARWFRGLLGGGGKKKPGAEDPAEARSARGEKKWAFGKSFRERKASRQDEADDGRKGTCREVPLRRRRARTSLAMDEEQNKRAIAVAAATAAVAEAAVAAAQAAAAVVRLTSGARGAGGFDDASAAFSVGFGKREKCAAVRIQSNFRGYLARRALKALKGLVKLQALVRGCIVRKQPAETLRCMQSLVRVQARTRSSRTLHSERSGSEKGLSTHAAPPTPENFGQAPRAGFLNLDKPSTIWRNDNIVERSAGWHWLDRWIDQERYWDSRELTKRATISASTDDERSAKVLEVDPGIGKPRFTNKRLNNNHPCSSNSHSFANIPNSPSNDSTVAHQSLPSPSSLDMQQSLGALRLPVEVGDYGETPHFYSASSPHGSSLIRRGPFTPSKTEFSWSLFSEYSEYPNYMADTESSRAKLRSQSAPKQRPDHGMLPTSFIKRSTVQEYCEQKNPSGASSAQKCALRAKFTNKAYPGSGRLDRLGMPIS